MVFGINTTLTFIRNFGTDIIIGVVDEVLETVRPERKPFVPAADLRPLGASNSGKDAITEALKSNKPEQVTQTIKQVCESEKLNPSVCQTAIYYCVWALKDKAPQVIADACANIVCNKLL